MNDNKKFWQRFAKLYSPFMEKGNGKMYDEICAEISAKLHPDMTVLELACGSGQLTFRLAGKVKRWEATDFSPNMIAEARKQFVPANLHLSVQDATNLPYEDERFDAVVIANALHIMPEPDKAMAEIYRVLKPGGLLFAPTFVHGSGTGFMLRTKMLELAGFHVFSKWTAKEFPLYVRSFQFAITDTKQMGSNIAPLMYLLARKERRELGTFG